MLQNTEMVAGAWFQRLNREEGGLVGEFAEKSNYQIGELLTIRALRDWLRDLIADPRGEAFDRDVIRIDRACTALFGEGG